MLILDEADRLLEFGFETSVNAIIARLPRQRRPGLFSATQTTAVKQLARAGLRNAVHINVAVQFAASSPSSDHPISTLIPSRTTPAVPDKLDNAVCLVPYERKVAALIDILRDAASLSKTIIFFLTCAQVDYFHAILSSLCPTLRLTSLHGQMTQTKRTSAFNSFIVDGGILLATDVAARGLDIPLIDFIVQFDAPLDPAIFIHRVGRTARMGAAGKALIILAPEEETFITTFSAMTLQCALQTSPRSRPSCLPLYKRAWVHRERRR